MTVPLAMRSSDDADRERETSERAGKATFKRRPLWLTTTQASAAPTLTGQETVR